MREIFYTKQEFKNGDIIEINIIEVEKSESHPEGRKYSMVFIKNNKRVIGYNNHQGHGHHKHIKGKTYPYEYTDEWQTVQDFMNDVDDYNEKGT